MNNHFNIIALLVLLCSCNKQEIGPQYEEGADVFGNAERKVFIVNEGNFNWGNASISLYDPVRKTTQQQLFSTVNSIPLGDVAQSMSEYQGNYYVTVNNSGKVWVLDTFSFNVKASIEGLSSPRYVCGCEDKLYISELYSGVISVASVETNLLVSEIETGEWSEHLLAVNGFVYAALPSGKLLQIDCSSSLVVDTILLNSPPGRMLLDTEERLWLTESGNSDTNPALVCINPQYNEILYRQNLHSPTAGKLCINPEGNRLLYSGGDGIYHYNITSNTAGVEPVIPTPDIDVYGFGVDPLSGEIYFSDALDYVQASNIYRYSSGGEYIDQFKGGIISSGFFFAD